MAQQQLEQPAAAVRLFDLATEKMRNYGGGRQIPSRQPWVNAEVFGLLHREAAQMIHGSAAASDSRTANDE